MSSRRELATFTLSLFVLVGCFLAESLLGGKVLSPADVLFVSAGFREVEGPGYEPSNRLLMDPVLQFQPWLEFNRTMIRQGRLPLWNSRAGCGAPHLANAQSAPFDPFHLIAYFGTLPDAHAWIAAARLWVAGLGMFLVARSWGLGVWGRWFAGLVFPFSGFMVVWLLFPVSSAMVWMPWVFWTTDRTLERPSARAIGLLGLVVGFTFLAGHIQTSAHVLLGAGVYAAWRLARRWRSESGQARAAAAWSAGVLLGVLFASVTIVPLGVYLSKSPVWADRTREAAPAWSLPAPRWLDTICTVAPYAFGSQRRGQPNLARALGVHNLNESAGGYVGLATLLWLAPAAWSARRSKLQVVFLAGLAAFGFLGAFGFPPVANLLRAAPVSNVMDHRRLTSWVAFALVLLGGIGLDQLGSAWPGRGRVSLWIVAAGVLLLSAYSVVWAGPRLRARASAHYVAAAAGTEGADGEIYRQRAERQVERTLEFIPRYFTLVAGELGALAVLATLGSTGRVSPRTARGFLLSITLAELFAFGFGLNPAIGRDRERSESEIIARLRRDVGRTGRVIGLGEELPPNVAMRYGLADARNYDSIELARVLDWFATLYEPSKRGVTSRSTITWAGVARAIDRLRESGVAAIVAPTPPPAALGLLAERVGAVWLVRLDAAPLVSAKAQIGSPSFINSDGEVHVLLSLSHGDEVVVRETFDPGWRGFVDGRETAIEPYRRVFQSIRVPAGTHQLTLVYDPPEVRLACTASFAALAALVVLVSRSRPFGSRSGHNRFPAMGLDVSAGSG